MTSHHDVAGDIVPRSEMIEALAAQRRRMGQEYDDLAAELKRVREVAKSEIENQAKALSEAEALAKQLSDALLKVRPLGGSELFIKRNGKYYADPKYCGDAIEERSAAYHEAMKESVRERKRALAAEARLAELDDYIKGWTSPSTMRQRAGEMTAQEVRTVQAVLSAVLDKARASAKEKT